jgi:HEAT repeat protein
MISDSKLKIKLRGRLNCFAFIFMSAIFFLLAIQPTEAAQPIYKGKPLGDWLILNLVADPSSQEAIRQIGTNGIPTLIELLGVKEQNVKKVLSKLHDKNLQYYYSQDDDFLDSSENLRKLAVNGFGILGTNAESALPQLTKIFDAHDSETMFQAGRALIKIGQNGFSVLTNDMNDTVSRVRAVVLRVIGAEEGIDPIFVRRFLINALKDPNPSIRLGSAYFLKGEDPDLVIPVLIPLLDDNNYGQCSSAAEILAVYGSSAKSAAPRLLSVYTNVIAGPDRKLANDLGLVLFGALKSIDRDTAAQAESFLVNSGPLNGARFGYTATLLKDGNELIAGGSVHTEFPTRKNSCLSSTELLNPKTGRRMETGVMATARCFHLAVLLKNGKVLVAGGSDEEGQTLKSAELYDPITGKWIETGPMKAGHNNDRMVLQSDGKVLVFSGGSDGEKKFSQEIYDPITGKWTVITNK